MRRKLLLAVLALLFALVSASADAKSKKHYPNDGGHYAGGKGSSHKGGHYKNARTHNHYTKHKPAG